MSFILDALRRAEAERERGAVPGLHSQALPAAAATDHRTGRARWALPLLALTCLLLLVALGLSWTRVGFREPGSAAPVPTGASAAMGSTAASAAMGSAAASADMGSASASAMPSAPTAAAAMPDGPALPAHKPAPELAAASAWGSTPSAAAARPRAGSAPASAMLAPPMRSAGELPEPWRAIVLRLSIGGAVHSDNPAQSFMMVGGQLVHEGDSLAPGVSVEHIGPRAAVLRAGPHRVEVGY